MGITETKKLIDCLTGNVLSLATIDYAAVKLELEDLDGQEKIDLMVDIGTAALEILSMFKGAPAILSKLLK
jgi:hypothetical protein